MEKITVEQKPSKKVKTEGDTETIKLEDLAPTF